MNNHMLMVGCGKMGSAIVEGIIESHHNMAITIIEPAWSTSPHALQSHAKVQWHPNKESLDPSTHVDSIIFCVKPQTMPHIVPSYHQHIQKNTIVISIAAGITLGSLEAWLPKDTSIIRTMPNLPAMIQEGTIVSVANSHCTASDRSRCEKLFTNIGIHLWIEDETKMHAVTAISGSGPAYLFHFLEAFSLAAHELGLDEDLANQLVSNTVYGAAKLAQRSTESSTDLRVQVTSPKGTTEAGLDILMPKLTPLLKATTLHAANRSKELSQIVKKK